MKKIICLMLVLATLLLLASCKSESTDAPNTTTTASTVETTTAPSTDETTAAKAEPQKKTIDSTEFGLNPVLVRGKTDIADITLDPDDGSLRLTSKAPGQAELVVENKYSEAATLKLKIGEDLGIAYEIEKFEAPASSANVRTFGATGNGVTDDTAAIQAAIDSLKDGGTVYIPKGKYMVSYLVFRKNIHIRLAGNLPDATVGYTDEVADYVNNGDVAVLRRNGKNNHMFYNLDKFGYCTEGVSGIALSGGVLDCATTGMAFVWACADGVRFENSIVKDISNNHAIQIDGCQNVTINNVMFAGYTMGSSLTRETIQIEPTTQGALGGDPVWSPVKCEDGDFRYNKSIAITGCYFGKSDISGPHLTPVGHHSSADEATCDGLVFSGNVVDNPLMYGLHLTNFVNVEIEDNLFISTKKSDKLASDSALINLYSRTNAVTYTDKNGVKITSSTKNEQIGNRNIVMRGNRFVLGGGTELRALHITGTALRPGAVGTGSIKRVDEWGGVPYDYSGYVRSTNVTENIEFTGNTVELQGDTAYGDHLFSASNVFAMSFDGNTFPTDKYSDKDACRWTNVTAAPSCMRVIEAKSTYGKIIFVTKDGEVEYACSSSGILTLEVEGAGELEVSVENGNVRVTVDELSNFEGWFEGESPVNFAAGFIGKTTITARFK